MYKIVKFDVKSIKTSLTRQYIHNHCDPLFPVQHSWLETYTKY
jgi:hypothetical protein